MKMKKYTFLCWACMQPVMILAMDVKQQTIIERTKIREAVAKVIVVAKKEKTSPLHKSQPISITGSDEFVIEKKEAESIIDLLRLSGSLNDQGCSPSLRDYL